MARPFARKFYKSKEWLGTEKNDYKDGMRYTVLDRDNYSCTKCSKPAEEVHHVIWLTPENINDWNVALNPDNLISLCRTCHIAIHRRKTYTQAGLKFNDLGELVEIK